MTNSATNEMAKVEILWTQPKLAVRRLMQDIYYQFGPGSRQTYDESVRSARICFLFPHSYILAICDRLARDYRPVSLSLAQFQLKYISDQTGHRVTQYGFLHLN